MAFILNDEQLERICERSPECGCDCMRCEAFAANQRYINVITEIMIKLVRLYG